MKTNLMCSLGDFSEQKRSGQKTHSSLPSWGGICSAYNICYYGARSDPARFTSSQGLISPSQECMICDVTRKKTRREGLSLVSALETFSVKQSLTFCFFSFCSAED